MKTSGRSHWVISVGVAISYFVFSALTAEGAAKRFVVASDGTGTHTTIQSAIEQADDGAVIEVRAGHYLGPIMIQKPLELRGVNWEDVIITTEKTVDLNVISERMSKQFGARGPGEKDKQEVDEVLAEFGFPLLKVRGSAGVVISGIKVVHGSKGDKNRLMDFALVDIENAKVTIRDIAVLGGPANGIAVRNGSAVMVTNCLVAAQWGTGIAIGSGDDLVNRAVIVDSEIRNCYHRCITIRSEREVRIERSRISGSAWHGIRYDDCSPVVEGCLISENARSGIYASGKTAATVRNNVFWQNGVSAWFANRDVIEGNTFVDPQRSGVSIIARTAPTIRSNLFQKNSVAITQSLTQGVRSEEIPELGEIAIDGNVFVENEGIWRGIADQKAEILQVEGSELEQRGNRDGKSGVMEIGKDFRLSEEFRNAYPGVGAMAPFAAESKWPRQAEELAILPADHATRDWRLWRN